MSRGRTEGGFLNISAPKFGFRKLLYNIREEMEDPMNVYTIKEPPRDADIAGILDVLSFAYVYHMMVVDYIYTTPKVLDQEEETLGEALQSEGEAEILDGLGLTDDTSIFGGGRGPVASTIADLASSSIDATAPPQPGSDDPAAAQEAADLMLMVGDRRLTEKWMDEYAGLMKKSIETVDEYARVLFGESPGLHERLAQWVQPDRPAIETKTPSPNIVLPDFMLRCSDVSMRFETKKQPAHIVWPGVNVKTHLLNLVLNPEYFTKEHTLLRPVKNDRKKTVGERVDKAGGVVASMFSFGGGGGINFADVVEAANAHVLSEKANDVKELDPDERMGVAMFTVFFALFRRAALPSFDDETYRYNDMNEVFAGVHDVTGCMVFASDRRDGVVEDSNVVVPDPEYNAKNRVFVIKAAKGSNLLKKSSDRKWELDVPPGSVMKEIMPGVAFDIAKEWIGRPQEKAYKPTFTDGEEEEEPETASGVLENITDRVVSDYRFDTRESAYGSVAKSLAGE